MYDRLSQHFASAEIFMDVDAIPLGADFPKIIDEAISESDVVIAVIGRHWLNVTDTKGKRRLDKSDDFVRLELASAFKRDIPVIPTLVDRAGMPAKGELPQDLADLAQQHGLEIDHARFRADSDRLIKGLEAIFKAGKKGAASSGRSAKTSRAQPMPSHEGVLRDIEGAVRVAGEAVRSLRDWMTKQITTGVKGPDVARARLLHLRLHDISGFIEQLTIVEKSWGIDPPQWAIELPTKDGKKYGDRYAEAVKASPGNHEWYWQELAVRMERIVYPALALAKEIQNDSDYSAGTGPQKTYEILNSRTSLLSQFQSMPPPLEPDDLRILLSSIVLRYKGLIRDFRLAAEVAQTYLKTIEK